MLGRGIFSGRRRFCWSCSLTRVDCSESKGTRNRPISLEREREEGRTKDEASSPWRTIEPERIEVEAVRSQSFSRRPSEQTRRKLTTRRPFPPEADPAGYNTLAASLDRSNELRVLRRPVSRVGNRWPERRAFSRSRRC